MPLYEYFCDTCMTSFEALVRSGDAQLDVPICPDCGERSRRILSEVNLSTGRQASGVPSSRIRDGKPDVTCLTLPPAARLCWMDNESAARLAAYKAGRGAEYDDTVARRKELASLRGESGTASPKQAHSHSPLSDQAVLSHRRRAAQKEKLVDSAAINQENAPKQS
jgi:putative FmdB family regulatory protein